jgi:hypothetical protein
MSQKVVNNAVKTVEYFVKHAKNASIKATLHEKVKAFIEAQPKDAQLSIDKGVGSFWLPELKKTIPAEVLRLQSGGNVLELACPKDALGRFYDVREQPQARSPEEQLNEQLGMA